jgi:hypothetical protein
LVQEFKQSGGTAVGAALMALLKQQRYKAINLLDQNQGRRSDLFTRILTNRERREIRDYLRTDGKRDSTIRSLVSRARSWKPQIEADMELLEALVARYEKNKSAST